MRTAVVTIRLDPKMQGELDHVCRKARRTRSDVVREALARQLALSRFEEARAALLPFAEAAGVVTDEDVFAVVS